MCSKRCLEGFRRSYISTIWNEMPLSNSNFCQYDLFVNDWYLFMHYQGTYLSSLNRIIRLVAV